MNLSYSLIALAIATAAALQITAMEERSDTTRGVPKLLSRRKRYLAFPDGSSVSAAICLTTGVIGNPNTSFLSWAVNWGVAYDLPNHSWVRQHLHGLANQSKALVQRRSRRSFYEDVQTAFEHMGFNGQSCVARALCESAKYLSVGGNARRQRGHMLEELVRVILSLPATPVEAHEPQEHHEYDSIYRRAQREVLDCSVAYPGCQFSLLELALGSYAAVPAQLKAYNYM